MRNKNTIGLSRYVWNHLFWSVLLFPLYRKLFFCPVFGLSYMLSNLLLMGMVLLGTALGILLTYRKRRNGLSVFVNIVLSYGFCFVTCFWNVIRGTLICAGATAGIIVALYGLLVSAVYRQNVQNKRTTASCWQCFSGCILNSRTLVSLVLAGLLIGAAVRPAAGRPVLEIKEDSVTAEPVWEQEGETIAGNLETVLQLQEDQWAGLDATERLKVMKTIADIEASYLGIPQVTVCAEVLDEIILGQYDDASRTVTLNLSYLTTENAQTMLRTVCHECYHAYQHRLVDLYDALDSDARQLRLFYKASQYRTEFANYIDGEENYTAYNTQHCEVDSNDYAQAAVDDYYYWIGKYMEETYATQMAE